MNSNSKLIRFILLAIFLIAFAGIAYSDESIENKIVATVYGRPMTNADILPLQKLTERKKKELSNEEYKTWVSQYKRRSLLVKISELLKEGFLKKHNSEPTEKEIQSHIDFSYKAKKGRLEKFQQQRKDSIEELKSKSLSERKKESLTNYIEIIDKRIAQEKRILDIAKKIPNYEEVERKAMLRVGKHVVRNWKYNQTLYRVYGGRIIFQQAGPEPIDAYVAVMKHWRETKSFEILDPTYSDLFAEYDRYLDMPHTFLKDKDAKKTFDKPYWEKDLPVK